jgi:acyl dehydratase
MSSRRPSGTIDPLAPESESFVSNWFEISQEMIDRFAEITHDPDPMHIDPVWARENGPFGGTIAFGFLTISLLTHLLHDASNTHPGKTTRHQGYYLNYGFNRLRLVAPVPAGARVRGRFRQTERHLDERGRWLTTFDCLIEIEGSDRPALAADWLSIWVPPSAT